MSLGYRPAEKRLGIFVPGAGIEPAQHRCHWCLRPARLPIPPSGQCHFQICFFNLFLFNQYFPYSSHPDGGIASPAVRLRAKNTHRVFSDAYPCHPGIVILKSVSLIYYSSINISFTHLIRIAELPPLQTGPFAKSAHRAAF